MYLGRVVGCVWSTVKDASLVGQRLLIIQPITPDRKDSGKRLICADATGAGAGETVYWVRGKEASFPFLPKEAPVDTTVVGIVDSIHLKPAAPAEGDAKGAAAEHRGAARPAAGARKGRRC